MKRTPFHSYHVENGGKLVDFAGWEMPIMFRSIHEEHHQVRTAGGLFDVSHMGRLKISGRHARKFLERIVTRRISDMPELTCRYALVCNPRGGVMDDVIVYRFSDYWMLVVNASNRAKILAHLHANVADLVVKIEDQTESTAMIAVQGPKVMEHVGRFSREVPTLKNYAFCIKSLLILKMIISRTGYTGEDGIEVILPAATAGMAIKMLVKDKVDASDPAAVALKPCGLGARDTLRTEAGMPLYGHELDETIDPLTAGLAWAVSLDKDQDENGEKFIGQDALKAIAAAGPTRKRIGLKLEGKRTARQGMKVLAAGAAAGAIGAVTSGCISPTLGMPIAMAYVDADAVKSGDAVRVELGDDTVSATVVELPFYRRAK